MKYAILVYELAEDFQSRNAPNESDAYWGAYSVYSKSVNDAGIAAGGAALEKPALATTLRLRDGKRTVQDGPFADTKELLGGFYLIDVDTIDEALEWASRCPSASTGCVEVRPLLQM